MCDLQSQTRDRDQLPDWGKPHGNVTLSIHPILIQVIWLDSVGFVISIWLFKPSLSKHNMRHVYILRLKLCLISKFQTCWDDTRSCGRHHLWKYFAPARCFRGALIWYNETIIMFFWSDTVCLKASVGIFSSIKNCIPVQTDCCAVHLGLLIMRLRTHANSMNGQWAIIITQQWNTCISNHSYTW